MLVHMHFHVYRNCSKAIHYFINIKYNYYNKICLITPQCVKALNKRKKKTNITTHSGHPV